MFSTNMQQKIGPADYVGRCSCWRTIATESGVFKNNLNYSEFTNVIQFSENWKVSYSCSGIFGNYDLSKQFARNMDIEYFLSRLN